MATNGLSERSASQSGSQLYRNTRGGTFFESYEQIIFKKLSKTSLDSHSREAPGTTTRPTPTALSACLTQQDTLFYHLPETV